MIYRLACESRSILILMIPVYIIVYIYYMFIIDLLIFCVLNFVLCDYSLMLIACESSKHLFIM